MGQKRPFLTCEYRRSTFELNVVRESKGGVLLVYLG